MSAEQLEKMQQEQYALEQEIQALENAENPQVAAEKVVAYIQDAIEHNREPMIAKESNEWSEAGNRSMGC